jgi:hypothetical protein
MVDPTLQLVHRLTALQSQRIPAAGTKAGTRFSEACSDEPGLLSRGAVLPQGSRTKSRSYENIVFSPLLRLRCVYIPAARFTYGGRPGDAAI